MTELSERPSIDYRSLFNEVNDGILVLGLGQDVLDVNRAMLDLFGYTRDEALRLQVSDLGVDREPFGAADLLRRLHRAALGKPQLFEWQARRKDGGEFWVEINLRLAELGRQECLLAVVRDIGERKRVEQVLRESEERSQTFLAQSSSGVFRLELEDPLDTDLAADEQVERIFRTAYLAECNPGLDQIYGRTPADSLLGSRPGDRFLPLGGEDEHPIEAFVRGGYRLSGAESRLALPDGSVVHVQTSLTGVVADRHLVRIWGTQIDITARKTAELDNLRLAAFARQSPYPIIECDARGFATYLNPATRHLLDTLAVDLGDLLPVNHEDIVQACLYEEAPSSSIEVECQERVFSWTYQPAAESAVVHLYGIEITDQRRAEARLQRNALQDELTGLPTRALLLDRLARNIDLNRRHADYCFALVLLDLDRFKVINESLGHEGGDRILVELSERLRSCVKDSDTIARTGGDEFVILLEDLGPPGNATRIADQIQQALARPFEVGGRELFIGASMGISISTGKDASPSDFIRDAETAMYRAKTAGQGRYLVFDRALHEQATEQLELETALRRALERREFVVHYQPIVHIHSLEITGFEALVRWAHPERGLIPPMRFIPLAEQCGLIEPIGEWVLETSCHQTRVWHAAGYKQLEASVNISATQFDRADIAERMRAVLQQTGLDARSLKLEITERLAAKDMDFAMLTLGELRKMGIRIMVDDFGTGLSSLSQIKRFPVDVLKIDRSFVKDLEQDEGDAAIVTTVILMSHALGFEVVAEGVETAGQLDFLQRRHCDYAQGYLFSRPVPADEFSVLLQRGVRPA
ncbi:MAG: EAL domain-containing protein [Deltaproteobacteria bacterium]|nr:EAL domain-containing protein [Deltaproteobacteria bacterium]